MTKIREGYKETEIGVIPEDWSIELLKDLSVRIGDGLHGTPKYAEDGQCYFINGNNLKNGVISISEDTKKVDIEEYEKYKVDLRETSVLISLNGTIGSLAFYKGEPIILSKSAGYITLKENQVIGYVYQALQTKHVKDFILKELTGTTIRNLSLKTLRNIPIAKGTFEEQQRIAEILSTTDEHIDKLDKIIEDYKLLKEGMIKKLLTEGIGHTEFKETEIGRIPKAWEVLSLGECFDFYGGYSIPRNQLTDDGVYYVHYGDIHTRTKTYIDTFEDKEWLPKVNLQREKQGVSLNTGDIVFADASEDYEGVGKSVVIYNDGHEIVAGLHTIVGKQKDSRFNNCFKRYFLESIETKKQLKKLATGSKVYGISKGNLGNIVIGIPSIEEQKIIASLLSNIDIQIDLYIKEKDNFIQLKKGLMEQLLTGKVRVI